MARSQLQPAPHHGYHHRKLVKSLLHSAVALVVLRLKLKPSVSYVAPSISLWTGRCFPSWTFMCLRRRSGGLCCAPQEWSSQHWAHSERRYWVKWRTQKTTQWAIMYVNSTFRTIQITTSSILAIESDMLVHILLVKKKNQDCGYYDTREKPQSGTLAFLSSTQIFTSVSRNTVTLWKHPHPPSNMTLLPWFSHLISPLYSPFRADLWAAPPPSSLFFPPPPTYQSSHTQLKSLYHLQTSPDGLYRCPEVSIVLQSKASPNSLLLHLSFLFLSFLS